MARGGTGGRPGPTRGSGSGGGGSSSLGTDGRTVGRGAFTGISLVSSLQRLPEVAKWSSLVADARNAGKGRGTGGAVVVVVVVIVVVVVTRGPAPRLGSVTLTVDSHLPPYPPRTELRRARYEDGGRRCERRAATGNGLRARPPESGTGGPREPCVVSLWQEPPRATVRGG